MKKIAKLLLVCIVLFGTFGCAEKDDGYKDAATSIIGKIDEMNAYSEKIAAIEISVWDVVGPSNVTDFLSRMLNSNTSQGFLDNFANVSDKKQVQEWVDTIFGTKMRDAAYKNMNAVSEEYNKAIDIFTQFSNDYSSLYAMNQELMNDIKAFKDSYSEKHGDELSKIVDLYLESSSFAEAVLNPSGSYVSFTADIKTYQDNISSLKKAVELSN